MTLLGRVTKTMEGGGAWDSDRGGKSVRTGPHATESFQSTKGKVRSLARPIAPSEAARLGNGLTPG
jgi:hypothetical protein